MGAQRRRRAVAAQQARPASECGAARGRRRLVRHALVDSGERGRSRQHGARMELKLEYIEQRVGAQTHLYPMSLTLVPRAVTVLLGATQAGKTTLMRVMAGLDAPIQGRGIAHGADVTGMPVRHGNVAMGYHQFINYPSMTVADNIPSPLKLA